MGDLIVPVCPAVMGLLFRNGLRAGKEVRGDDGITLRTLRSPDGKTVLGVRADKAASNRAFKNPRGRLTSIEQRLAMALINGMSEVNSGYLPENGGAGVTVIKLRAPDCPFLGTRTAEAVSELLKHVLNLPAVLIKATEEGENDAFVRMLEGIGDPDGRTFRGGLFACLRGQSNAGAKAYA